MVIPGYPDPVTAKAEACYRMSFDHLPRRGPNLLSAGVGVILHFLLAEISAGILEVAYYGFSAHPTNSVGK